MDGNNYLENQTYCHPNNTIISEDYAIPEYWIEEYIHQELERLGIERFSLEEFATDVSELDTSELKQLTREIEQTLDNFHQSIYQPKGWHGKTARKLIRYAEQQRKIIFGEN
ncbi:MAG: hypothetical protein WC438_04245 [Candidatus Pacearchaeota archaeon]